MLRGGGIMSKKVKKNRKMKKSFKILILLLIFGFGALGAYYALNGKGKKISENIKEKVEEIVEKKEEPKLQVYDANSNKRPIAVMIPHDTWGGAQDRQYGIQDAYIIYEIFAEGGITRLMALFKDVNTEKIGPIRSSRSYYLDYAMESDAIYVHWGYSPQAQADIPKYGINNINGLAEEGISVFRDSNYSAPNNGFTSIKSIYDRSEQKKYATTSDKWKLFDYSVEPLDLTKDETYKVANNVNVYYTGKYSAKYKYDADKKYYLRFNNDKAHIDNGTKEQLHVKNIIILKINNHLIAGDTKGRIDLENIGSGKGYYITDGGMIDITWKKDSRTSKTEYRDSKGNKLVLNDGNTFIQVQPVNSSVDVS